MLIHVIGPNGQTHGPFQNRADAQRFGTEKWPGKIIGSRDEDPDAWEIVVDVPRIIAAQQTD